MSKQVRKMKTDDKGVKLLIKEGEGLMVEFKEKYTSKIDEDIVAFANTKGGVILLGVRDDRTIAGEQLTNEMKGRINSLARNCKPDIPVNAMQVGDVVVIEVPEGNEKPYYCGSGYFRRLNGNSQKMNHEEIRIMFSENEVMPFEEKTVRDFTYDDISREKILAFTKEAGINIGRISTVDFLKSLSVVDDINIKNAGILFFAKEVQKHISQAQMTLIAFKGTKKLHIFDRLDVRDDLLTQFNEAIFFIKKHLNIRSEIKGVNREDIFEIPIEALREAVVNAIMHRDYSVRGTSLTVEVYDDRVEITTPGGAIFFRPKKEDIFPTKQKVGEEVVRNGGQISTQKWWSELTERQKIILQRIKEKPTVSRKELSVDLRINESAVQKHLENLKKKGLLRRIGADRGGYWEVVGG